MPKNKKYVNKNISKQVGVFFIFLFFIILFSSQLLSLELISVQSTPEANQNEKITFTINYVSKNPVSSYICSTPRVGQMGCLDKPFSEKRFIEVSPIVQEYTTLSTDNSTTYFWLYLCEYIREEDEMKCLEPYVGSFKVNHIPFISNVQLLSTGNFSDTDNLICNVSASDSENDNLTYYYSWYYTRDNEFTKANVSPYDNRLSNRLIKEGDIWYCGVRATDGKAFSEEKLSNPARINFQYSAPFVKSMRFFSAGKETNKVTIGEETYLEVDYYSNSPVVAYACDNSLIFDSGCSATQLSNVVVSLNSPLKFYLDSENLAGKSEIYVKICDSAWQCSGIYSIGFSMNNKPIINSLILQSSGNFSESDNLICNLTASDIDNDNLQYYYKWYYVEGGKEIFFPYEDGAILSHSSIEDNTIWFCEGKVDDSYSLETKKSNIVYIGIPTPTGTKVPVITALADNSGVAINTGLSLIITLNYNYDKNVRGYVCSSKNILPSGCFDKEYAKGNGTNGTIEFRFNVSENMPSELYYYVRIFDSENKGSDIVSRKVKINHKPSATAYLSNVKSTGMAECTYSFIGNDIFLDGTPDLEKSAEVNWYYNNSIIQKNGTLNISYYNIKKDNLIRCSVKVTDIYNLDSDEIFSNEALILNSEPKVNVRIYPENPKDGDNLTCIYNGYDPDSDNLTFTYLWFRNNEMLDSLTSEIVPEEWTSENDTWICQAFVSDGLDYSYANYSVFVSSNLKDAEPNSPGTSSPQSSGSSSSSSISARWEGSRGGFITQSIQISGEAIEGESTNNNKDEDDNIKISSYESQQESSGKISEIDKDEEEAERKPIRITGSFVKSYSSIFLDNNKIISAYIILCCCVFLYFYIRKNSVS